MKKASCQPVGTLVPSFRFKDYEIKYEGLSMEKM